MQLVDYVLLEACTGCPPAVKQRVTRILAQRRASLKTIRHIMRGKSVYKKCYKNIFQRTYFLLNTHIYIYDFIEYAGNLGDAGDTEWREAEQQHILQLIDKF